MSTHNPEVVGSSPASATRKGTRLDTISSLVFLLCWNDYRNWVLFQLFSLYRILEWYGAVSVVCFGKEGKETIRIINAIKSQLKISSI